MKDVGKNQTPRRRSGELVVGCRLPSPPSNAAPQRAIASLECWMKDEGYWQNQPLAAEAASLWSAVASQIYQSNPAPEAPGKGGITTTRTIITNPHRVTPSNNPSAVGAPRRYAPPPAKRASNHPGGDSRQQPLATTPAKGFNFHPPSFIQHPDGALRHHRDSRQPPLTTTPANAFNFHLSSFIQHPF